MGRFVYRTKYTYPDYKLKSEFYVGTFGENDWQLGEVACVDRVFYRLPNGSEYAIFKFAERTRTGGKRLRWEEWHNGNSAITISPVSRMRLTAWRMSVRSGDSAQGTSTECGENGRNDNAVLAQRSDSLSASATVARTMA